jgi:hypothetical protein
LEKERQRGEEREEKTKEEGMEKRRTDPSVHTHPCSLFLTRVSNTLSLSVSLTLLSLGRGTNCFLLNRKRKQQKDKISHFLNKKETQNFHKKGKAKK